MKRMELIELLRKSIFWDEMETGCSFISGAHKKIDFKTRILNLKLFNEKTCKWEIRKTAYFSKCKLHSEDNKTHLIIDGDFIVIIGQIYESTG